MRRYIIIVNIIFFGLSVSLDSIAKPIQSRIHGRVTERGSAKGIPFAYVVVEGSSVWVMTNEEGYYEFRDIPKNSLVLQIGSLGYTTLRVEINGNVVNGKEMNFELTEQTLELDDVTVIASEKTGEDGVNTYTINKQAIDNLQVSAVTDVMALLPGGKFQADKSLLSMDSEFSIRSEGGSTSAATFGVGVEVDGVRLGNNASAEGLIGIDTRSLSVGNIESVEVVTGVPSVEHGDLNSGLVKIKTQKGASPYVIEASMRPNTQRYSARKGFALKSGVLNVSAERASSVGNLSHPFTTYDRNGLTLNYLISTKNKNKEPISINIGAAGNIGGYNDKNDPDQRLNTYAKSVNNTLRANMNLNWSTNRSWITRLNWHVSGSFAERHEETNKHNSSASSNVSMHSLSEGYHMAEIYKNTSQNAVLIPAGNWYETLHYDDKPFDFNTKLKLDWNRDFGQRIRNKLMIGGEYSLSKNFGVGEYYEDFSTAPTWRPYVLKDLSAINNFSLFAEENFHYEITEHSSLRVVAGIRYDGTYIANTPYGLNSAFSPRANVYYSLLKNKKSVVKDLELRVSWGKATKLPSLSILNPKTSYVDINTFASPSDDINTSYRAYTTHIATPVYNADLKWQSSTQLEVGAKVDVGGVKFSTSAYLKEIKDSYTSIRNYEPFSYNYTGPEAMQGIAIPSANRDYVVDKQTGIVTVVDKTRALPSTQLDYKTYNKFRSRSQFINGAPLHRLGLEWAIESPQIKVLKTKARIDGNLFYYKTINEIMQQSSLGIYQRGSDGEPYKYIAHFVGGSSVANGEIEKGANLNLTITTHIPKARIIIALHLEATLLDYSQNLSEWSEGDRSFAMENTNNYVTDDTDIYGKSKFVITYPTYYSTWDKPDEKIPFKEKLIWAKDNNQALYNDLLMMVERSNYAFTFNPLTYSAYYSANITVTKEIKDIASVSFFATNFLNNMQKVKSSWGKAYSNSIYGSGKIPKFYCGMSLRIKL